jgi:hypothetical protein
MQQSRDKILVTPSWLVNFTSRGDGSLFWSYFCGWDVAKPFMFLPEVEVF